MHNSENSQLKVSPKAFTLKNLNTPIKKLLIVIKLKEFCQFLWQHSMHKISPCCSYLERQQILLETSRSSVNPHLFQAFHYMLYSELDPFIGIKKTWWLWLRDFHWNTLIKNAGILGSLFSHEENDVNIRKLWNLNWRWGGGDLYVPEGRSENLSTD